MKPSEIVVGATYRGKDGKPKSVGAIIQPSQDKSFVWFSYTVTREIDLDDFASWATERVEDTNANTR